MEDWEIPNQDDFESRYADELEMLNEIDEEVSYQRDPKPRKSLVFPTPDKEVNIEQSILRNGVSQAMKRQIDEMYALLSDDDDSGEETLDDRDGRDVSQANIVSQAKRARISTSPERNARADKHQQNSLTPASNNRNITSRSPPQTVFTTSKVFTRPPVGRDCISLTGCDRGRRVYLSLNKDDTLDSDKVANRKSLRNKRTTHLLGIPFSVLKETVYEQRRVKLHQESKRITESLNNVIHEDTANYCCDVDMGEECTDGVKEKGLWVDKYSPRSYIELLSDDGINRNLLAWLKLWDSTVFHKEKPKKKKNDKIQSQKQDKNYNYNKEKDTEWMELDATGRPVNKIALLCGPPGLGKTTLAHVVAQHAGYSVVEMNASDDRSVDVFRNKIESATQMQSVLDSGRRPNCLVIDEIDGAPTPAINVLLSLIKKKDLESSNQLKKKKRKKAEMLSRPIICICNDPFVPALRQLRQQAFVLTFPPTLSGRLAQRLMEVSKKEILQTDMTTLLALCEKAENDIRSCLNTLQFLRQRKQNLTIDFVQSANIGQKDSQKSLFALWQAIFQLPRPKKKRFALLSKTPVQEANTLPNLYLGDPFSNPEMTSSATRFYNMLHLASSNGQYHKLEDGIYENYLNMKFKDAYLNLVVSATEWLEFADLLSESLHQQQNFVLMRYQPFLSVAFHMFFAGPSQPKLNYPSTKYENKLKETKIVNIISSLLKDIPPHILGNLDTRIMVIELLPLLLHIVTPTVRPVNTQLFSSSEKQQLVGLIHTMISYNLTYHQEKSIEGHYTYLLDPNIEDAVKFPGLPQHKQLTYATKQLIAREIDLEKMRRMEKVLKRRNGDTDVLKNKEQTEGQVSPTNSSSPLVLQLKPKELKPSIDKTIQEKDFFGRPIIAKHTTTTDDPCQDNSWKKSKLPFWFKFQEGFSNAVRRTVKIQDLL